MKCNGIAERGHFKCHCLRGWFRSASRNAMRTGLSLEVLFQWGGGGLSEINLPKKWTCNSLFADNEVKFADDINILNNYVFPEVKF